MSVLLCIHYIPENVEFYQVDPTEDEIRILKLAHDKYLNTINLTKADNKALMYVLAAVSDQKMGWDGVPKSVIGKWADKRVPESSPAKIHAKRLVITGMLV